MLRALLCDDNEIILEGLSQQIRWSDFGIIISGTASDGKDAKKQIEKSPPDILITDIRMPYVNGLDLSKYAKSLNPNIVIIIISAYDDFEYARSAMHLQAIEYLLKPIDIDEMNRVLSRAILYCQQFRENKQTMSVRLLQKASSRNLSRDELKKYIGSTDIAFFSWFCSMYIVLDPRNLQKLSDNIRFSLTQRFSELSPILRQADVYLLEATQYTYFFCFADNSEQNITIRRDRLLEKIRTSFPQDQLYGDLSTATGNIVYGLDKLHVSTHNCLAVEKLHFIKGANTDLIFKEVESYINRTRLSTANEPFPDTQLVELITDGNKPGITEELEKLKTWLYAKGSDSYLYMTFSLGSFYSKLMQELGDTGIDLQEIFQDPISEFQKIAFGTTLESTMENLRQILFKICDGLSLNKNRYKKLITQSLGYIQNNYSSSSLSIEEVAHFVSLSTSYFSTVFKNEAGVNFTDYLIRIRMEKAKLLLKKTDLKMYEIASRVGYDNPAYFSVAFKRYYGKSPSEIQRH